MRRRECQSENDRNERRDGGDEEKWDGREKERKKAIERKEEMKERMNLSEKVCVWEREREKEIVVDIYIYIGRDREKANVWDSEKVKDIDRARERIFSMYQEKKERPYLSTHLDTEHNFRIFPVLIVPI